MAKKKLGPVIDKSKFGAEHSVLCLQIKMGESVMIGDNIEIKLMEKHGSYVKAYIAAPRSVRIDRSSLII